MHLSFQLYSARNFPPLEDVFALLARLGYRQVEGYGGLYEDPGTLAATLARNGLAMPTGHFGLDMLEDHSRAIAAARALGVKTLYCPAVPQPLWSQPEADWVRLAERLEALSAIYRAEGFGFGWHNHHFEFWPTESGRLPMDILLQGAPSIEWEIDIAWVVRGGADPFDWIGRYGDRITAAHFKDLAPEGEAIDEDGWADPGHGRLDWPALKAALESQATIAHMVAEHDNPNDLGRFASRALATAETLGVLR
ncbi:sugar phosphate isomerase/epimerase [Arsenicitalea aurantiaca]|uniref:Sugar phosphate isomerase/epimerase n=1 Tax=Arsenicitalea aurantiaca TaxID=1783274 RepID=A0A433XF76_9HYPH|nr:sugar phosphate isomerase/epimerase [Arsenicitalea aurantiaca]RUT32598.1 sugar phosphate isomerase/epimerase [Arsenicitalea aurantiaca]